jgi:hypothetical protein
MFEFKIVLGDDGQVNVTGPLERTDVCDVMLQAARRIVDSHWQKRQTEHSQRIVGAKPMDPMLARMNKGG